MSRNDLLEAEAQHLLLRLLGGTVVPLDVPPAQGMRDFDLVDDGGPVRHAIEVTSVQLAVVRGTRAGMERLRQEDLGLTQSWSISIHETADLRPIRASAASLLNELTTLGVDRFNGIAQAQQEAASAIQQLAEIGIVAAYALSNHKPPRILASAFGSGSLDPMNVTTAVETELEKEDNRRKLKAAPAGATRHLFVWLHDSHWHVASVLRDQGFPLPPAPLLPPDVDIAWIAVAGEAPGEFAVLLRVDAAGIAAVDLVTGALLPLSHTQAGEGPPYAASPCPVCGSSGQWEVSRRTRVQAGSGATAEVLAWDVTCAADNTHFRGPGRALTKKERADLQGPPEHQR